MISGGRTEQLDIFFHVTGITSDFLSFIDVELIRFFHGALQLWHNQIVFVVCPSRVIDVGSEWRTFNNEKDNKDNSRVGASEVCYLLD